MKAFVTLLALTNSSFAIQSRLFRDIEKQYQGKPIKQPEYHKDRMDPKELQEYVDNEARNLDTYQSLKKGETPISKVPQLTRSNQKEQPLTVHLIPHSHCDSGWLKTMDEYYYGSNFDVQHASVKAILDTTINELGKDKSRKFTFAEMGFFQQWYNDQSLEKKNQTKNLIKSGQLEIVNGGISAPDEATPQFEDLIDVFMAGHQFLKKEFDFVPKVGWTVDAFGHTDTNARLFHEMGFDSQFFARIDNDDSDNKRKTSSATFLWRPSSTNFGNQHQILTYLMESYTSPKLVGADEFYEGEDNFVTDKTLSTFNANEIMMSLVNFVQEDANARKGHNLIVPMGGDWSFQNAQIEYQKLDAMIPYFNQHNTANIVFQMSTPSDYIEAIKKENIKWPVRYDDFVPYMEKPDWWTGFYSSRPDSKKFIHDFSSMTNGENKIFSQMMIKKNVSDETVKSIIEAKSNTFLQLGINIHHDAITGTSKPSVHQDFDDRLSQALYQNSKVYKQEISQILKQKLGVQLNSEMEQCMFFSNNTSLDCPISKHKNATEFLVIAHNTANFVNKQFSRVMLPDSNYRAQKWDGVKFVDIAIDIMQETHFTLENKVMLDYQMFIPMDTLPNDIAVIKVIKGTQPQGLTKFAQSGVLNDKQNQSLSLEGFSEGDSVVFKFQDKSQNISQSFGLGLRYYKSHLKHQSGDKPGGSDEGWRTLNWAQTKGQDLKKIFEEMPGEGAYIFKPEHEGPNLEQYSYPYSNLMHENVVFQEGVNLNTWTIQWNNETTKEQVIVTVRHSPYYLNSFIEFEVEANSLQITELDEKSKKLEKGRGKDFTVNWKMFDGFDPKGKFYTDSNSLGMMEREIGKKAQNNGYKKAVDANFIPSNYFPITSAIAMRDQNGTNLQVTILNDRAQGGSADLSEKSSIELMQNRRTTTDDDKGLCGGLNHVDKDGKGLKITAKYMMQIFDFKKQESKQREQQIINDEPFEYFFSFNYSTGSNNKLSLVQKANTSQSINDFGVDLNQIKQITYHTIPLEKHKILARFENLADKFDYGSQKETKYIDVYKFAEKFWMQANPGASENMTIAINETSLTDNQPQKNLTEKWNSGFHWIGDTDGTNLGQQVVQFKQAEDKSMKQLALEPQRIRSFVITYEFHPWSQPQKVESFKVYSQEDIDLEPTSGDKIKTAEEPCDEPNDVKQSEQIRDLESD